MSLDTSSRRIQCDTRDCLESVAVPILWADASDAGRAARTRSKAAGWIFVTSTYEDRHYCPQCAEKLLARRAA